jgi:tetratricopeptide (TPR) repeat protein
VSRSWPILASALFFLASPPETSLARPQEPLTQEPRVLDPRVTSESLFLVALEGRRRGDERFAASVLERVVRLDPEAVLPRLEWAEALLTLRESGMVEALLLPLAARIDEEAVKRPDSAARYYRLRGGASARAGQKAEALELYERAIELSPEHLGMRSLVVSMYRSSGNSAAAARHLVAAASLRPGDSDLRVEAGRALLTIDRFEEAELEFRAALRIDLWAVAAWEGLGRALAGQRRWANAEEVIRSGIGLAPDSASLHELLGDALLEAGRTKEALVWYRRAAALEGADVPALGRKIERVQAQFQP